MGLELVEARHDLGVLTLHPWNYRSMGFHCPSLGSAEDQTQSLCRLGDRVSTP